MTTKLLNISLTCSICLTVLLSSLVFNKSSLALHKHGSHITVPPAIQTIMFAGDRYLASNFEYVRAATAFSDVNSSQKDYEYYALNRASIHNSAQALNPCHEENYNLANAILTWGGLENQGNQVLLKATDCRFWDEFPPFFYSVNQYFFENNLEVAEKYALIAEQRTTKNKVAFKKFAIALATAKLENTKLAINLLQTEIDKANDPKLKEVLNKRKARLEGLQTLEIARKKYENSTNQTLVDPYDLLRTNILDQFPNDPTRLGYELKSGRFTLRSINIAGANKKQ